MKRTMKRSGWVVATLLLSASAFAGDRPLNGPGAREVLDAKLVAVVMEPGSEVVLENPAENQRAVHDVENALARWGRYSLTTDPSQADLIIVVRKGRARATTVRGGNKPPVIVNPNDTGINIGVHKGQAPPLSRTDPGDTARPTVGTQIGPSEDLFEVYRGGSYRGEKYPLDNPPIWRHMGKNALDAPAVEAVQKFRKAVELAAKKQP